MEKAKKTQSNPQQKMQLANSNIYNITLDLNEELKNIIKKDNQYTIPIFIPHSGCKNECVFCNQRKITGNTESVTKEQVDKIIREYLKYFDSAKSKGKKITGIYISMINTYKTLPKVDIKFRNSESGSSGGLIETLDIYNKLVKEDITKGMKIAGTGEIDSNGNVLPIGEVKYKLLGASRKNADIFIVPNGENYKTCMKVKKDKNLKIKIIGVSTFKEALAKLK